MVHTISRHIFIRILSGFIVIVLLSSGCANVETPTPEKTGAPATPRPTQTPQPPAVQAVISSRGYQTTPEELKAIASKAEQGKEPYQSAMANLLQHADQEWNFTLQSEETCPTANDPAWNDNGGGTPVLYAKAMAFHLTGEVRYAEEVKAILERIMTEVERVDPDNCRLEFAWGTPELVSSADLIEDYWIDQTCRGPMSTDHFESELGSGNCKELFQNWLAKNPYYVISFSSVSSKANAGAAATTALAFIADYLWDRPEIELVHRLPPEMSDEGSVTFSPAEAYVYVNKLALDRMNGYGIEYGSSSSCDLLEGEQQKIGLTPVKSQITERGIIPEDARREEYCNITEYNGKYQNYPQLHLGLNIQQCELMLRRGDSSCYDNVDNTDIPDYTFIGPDGESKTTHLYSGRGSIERAIKAIVVDSGTEWHHDPALQMAYRYYYNNHTLPGFELWADELIDLEASCGQDVCLGALTHGFAIEDGSPSPPPTVPPP